MTEPEIILEAQSDCAFIPTQRLRVVLSWNVDEGLDLMAFYKTKDGQIGGVFAEEYVPGSRGILSAFPYIQLQAPDSSSHSRSDATVLRIATLDHIKELSVRTIDLASASRDQRVPFGRFDAYVTVTDDKGKSTGVALEANQPGTVAIIAGIDDSSPIGPELLNENRIMDMPFFLLCALAEATAAGVLGTATALPPVPALMRIEV